MAITKIIYNYKKFNFVTTYLLVNIIKVSSIICKLNTKRLDIQGTAKN